MGRKRLKVLGEVWGEVWGEVSGEVSGALSDELSGELVGAFRDGRCDATYGSYFEYSVEGHS